MKSSTDKILELRKDMSDYVFHFTKGADGRKTFQTILEQRKLKDISGKGFICFTEAPLPALVELFAYFNRFQRPMYCPYGIGIRKEIFFPMGGRPVIYGNDDDLERLKSIGFEWRTLRYAPSDYDFSWLREWRIPLHEIELTYDNCIAVVPSLDEEKELLLQFDDITVDAEPEDGGFSTYYYEKDKRIFRGVNLEQLQSIEKAGISELESMIEQCKEIEEIYLGSEWK